MPLTSRHRLVVVLVLLLTGCGDNLTLSRLAADDVVLAYGDSITFGTGAGDGESYPEVLQTLIGRRVVASGVPGEISQRGLQRLPEVLLQVRPKLVILCHGGNDILRRRSMAEAGENLRAMIRLVREHGAEVVLIGVPRFGLLPKTAPVYLQVAEDMEVVIEPEILPAILADNTLKADPVHPNAEGYGRLARAVQALLEERGAI